MNLDAWELLGRRPRFWLTGTVVVWALVGAEWFFYGLEAALIAAGLFVLGMGMGVAYEVTRIPDDV